MILEERTNLFIGELWVLNQLAVLPTCKAFTSANPECPIACGEQFRNIAAWKLLARRRLPWHAPKPVEAMQAEFRPKPEIPVGRLPDCLDRAVEKTVTGFPRSVSVLIDFPRRVQCESARTPGQQEA